MGAGDTGPRIMPGGMNPTGEFCSEEENLFQGGIGGPLRRVFPERRKFSRGKKIAPELNLPGQFVII
jgi:hypothetical protein